MIVNNLMMHPVKGRRLSEIRSRTLEDLIMKKLAEVIATGWPSDKRLLPDSLKPFFDYRDELTPQDGLILRGQRIIILLAMRSELKQKSHVGHLGINSCLRRVRDLIFWPGISAEIRQYVQACATCATYADHQPAEPFIIREVPKRPWQRVTANIFSWGVSEYLVTVDKLSNSTSDTVISRLRSHFARYGIPDTLVSDNGPQFSSNAFRKFLRDGVFIHKTISPGNSQANNAVEAAVKIMKRLMQKCKAPGEDLLLRLLKIHNTSTEGLNTSPAQKLLRQRRKSMVPTTETLLKPSYPYSYDEAQNKEDRKLNQHGTGRELSHLHYGSNVQVQPLRSHAREWEEATIRKK